MALTPEQFEALKAKLKALKSSETQQAERLADFQFEQPSKVTSVVTGFFGGGKLAEGLGGALASGEVRRTFEAEQQQTSEMQSRLLARIREKRALGEDTSRLEKTLRESQGLARSLSKTQKGFEESLPTGEQVVGSAVRLGSNALAGMAAKAVTNAFGVSKAVGFGAGALRGTGAGAVTGGLFGGLQAGGASAEANKSSMEVLQSGILGAISGAGLGAGLGAVAGGISGRLQARAIKSENFVKELVSPKQTAKVREEAIRQGRLKDPGLFKKAEIEFSKRDKLVADSVKDVVKPKMTIGQNIDAIRSKISNTDNGVRDFITKNKVPFNTAQLNSKLEAGKNDLRLVFASDTTAEKTFDAVSKEFMRNVSKKDTLGLFDARQSFDRVPAVKKLLESDRLGENARREIVLAVRRAANEYIASLLPKGNQYKEAMMNQHYALEALGNLAEKSTNIIGKNRLQILVQEYPIIKWIVGAAAGGISAGVGFNLGRGVGAGSSIISSTD